MEKPNHHHNYFIIIMEQRDPSVRLSHGAAA